ncbi:MAG: DNA-directed RNA polymerase subunit omega [Clostridiales bacterium]|nr:DNA-directed RNA polymerase subunit omega [Clostridiales bacterium]
MLKPVTTTVLDQNECRYSLVVATAKLARKISQDAEDNKTILKEKPVSMAVAELFSGKFRIEMQPETAEEAVQEDIPSEEEAPAEE